MDPDLGGEQLRASLEGDGEALGRQRRGRRGERAQGDHSHGSRGALQALKKGRGLGQGDQGDTRGGGLQLGGREDRYGPVPGAEGPRLRLWARGCRRNVLPARLLLPLSAPAVAAARLHVERSVRKREEEGGRE